MDVRAPATVLGGLTPVQFMRRHWHKRPLLVRQALPGVRPPLERAALFELAARDDVESRLVQRDASGAWKLRRGPLPRRALPPLARPGWTLLVQGLDLHVDAAQALLSRFRFVPEARLDDLMLSYASDGGGVGPHLDSYDVFLLQVAGRRRWRYGRIERPRWRDDVPLKMLATFTPEQDHVLETGDLLYLPPGWAHDGVAVGADAMTASVGFRSPTAGELARAVLARLADSESFDRRDQALYRDASQSATTIVGAVPPAMQAHARVAVDRLVEAPGAVECALGEWLTEPKPQVWFQAAGDRAAAAAGQGVRLDRRTRMLYDERHLYINGESWRAAGRDAQALRRLADARSLEAAELARLSPGAREVIAEWLAAGWLQPDSGGQHDQA
jgi:50S ribosomal protein L16 3-hydroxylase